MSLKYPSNIPVAFASSGDKTVIPFTDNLTSGGASFEYGFPPITQLPISAGGIAPKRNDFNGIFNIITEHLIYNQSGSPVIWNENLDYPINSKVFASDGNEYICLLENGINITNIGIKEPSESPLYWQNVNAQINTNISNISALESSVSTNTSDINSLQSSLSSINTSLSDKAPTSHASTGTSYGMGNASNYGHVKLSDAVNSTSGASEGIAATPAAVKQVYDLLSSSSSSSIPSYTNAVTLFNKNLPGAGNVTNTTTTVTADGIVSFDFSGNYGGYANLFINNASIGYLQNNNTGLEKKCCSYPVAKGDAIYTTIGGGAAAGYEYLKITLFPY